MFAFQRAIVALRESDTLSFSLVFGGYKQFFSSRFSSNYAFIKTLVRLLIVYLASSFVDFVIVYIVFMTNNYMGMRELYESISEMSLNRETIEILTNDYHDLLLAIRFYTDLPSLFLVSLSALFFYSRNSISYFMRISAVNYSGRYISSLHQLMIRNNKKAFYRAFFSLNWPLFVLFVFGFVMGGFVGYITYNSLNYVFTFALAFSIFVSFAFFGFKYFANKEALYLAFIDDYQKTDEMVKKSTSTKLEEMKRKEEEYQKLLKEIEEELDSEDDEDDKED